MKARVVKTGEIIEVYKDLSRIDCADLIIYTTMDEGRHFTQYELDFNFENKINWKENYLRLQKVI